MSVTISVVKSYLPTAVLTNADLARSHAGWTADKIFLKTGIRERHIAAGDETAADLAMHAAERLFAEGSVERSAIDFLIFCTQAPDYILPTTACILQHKLGLRSSVGAIDVNLGCSGFLYCLALAKGIIETLSVKKVLLLTGDTYSKYIHPDDRSVRTLFGDGAAATLVTASSDESSDIGPFIFGTDGSGAHNLIVEAGMFRLPCSETTRRMQMDSSGNGRTREHLFMNGAEVMAFSLREVPRAVDDLLIRAGLAKNDIDYFLFHQANKFMLESLRKKIQIPAEKFPIFLDACGNTVSSSIPLLLENMLVSGIDLKGKRIMLVGFGVGYSWSGCIIRF